MRVVMTADTVGGVWHYATTLASTLAEMHGVQVLLAITGPAPSREQQAAIQHGRRRHGGGVELEILDAPLEWEGASDSAYAALRDKLLTLALQWRGQLLHANEHHLGQLGASGLPVVVVSHSDLCSWRANVLQEVIPQASDSYVAMVKAGLAGAASVVAPSSFVAASLQQWFGYGQVIRVIANGVTAHPGEPSGQKDIDAIVVGRLWDPAKGLACFVDAVSQLPPGAYYAAGPTEASHGAGALEGGITYTGQLEHVSLRCLLGRAWVFVSPALYDPFGLAAVEAALAGCALVLADLPSYQSIWEDTATYFNPRSAADLATSLHMLLADKSALAERAAMAQARAARLYTAERMAAAYLATYQRVSLRYGLAL
jgi:glycosyltransferase involved in cell wall biosynthesis